MIRLTFHELLARKRRLVGTWLAVFLGVSFLAGALTLGDTLRANFDSLFADVNAGTDVVVRNELDLGGEAEEAAGAIDAAALDAVRRVDGVAAAVGTVAGYGQIVGADGEPLGGGGPPTLAGSWVDDPELTPWRLVDGRAPGAAGEVVINRGAADDGALAVGDRTTILVPQPVGVEVVGIATFGEEDGLGPTTQAFFTLPVAQELLLGRDDALTTVVARAEDGLSPDDLVARVAAAAPDGVEVESGAALAQEATADIDADFLSSFRRLLVAFAVIALVVASFSIHNTFAMLAAQRTRESALLRALGATRRQVLGSLVLEAVAVGVVASAAGVLGGLGFAGGLKGIFDAAGFALPAGGLELTAGSLGLAFVTGLVVTVVAAVAPAVRASKVAPLAALREVAVDGAGTSRARTVAGGVVGVVGAGLLATGSLGAAGIGALLLVGAAVALGPTVARPASRLLGAPVARLRGVTGSLARDNAVRNPRRTAATASALLVGVGVVSLFTVVAASAKASVEQTVTRSFTGDFVLTTGRWDGGVDPALAREVAALDGVDAAVGIGGGRVLLDGERRDVSVVDTQAVGDVLDLDGDLRGVGAGEVAVTDEHDLAVGDDVELTFPDGAVERLQVGAVFERADLVRSVVLPREVWAPHASQQLDGLVLVEGGEDAAIGEVASRYGVDDVLDGPAYAEQAASGVDMALGLVYVMLALAIVIALLGISNTLSLAVHERTRELGLLRAVGATRRQVRSMVRWESVLVAALGTSLGIGLGVALAAALVASMPFGSGDMALAVPGSLVVVLVAGAAAGVLAALRPARRAARLDVLGAIAAS